MGWHAFKSLQLVGWLHVLAPTAVMLLCCWLAVAVTHGSARCFLVRVPPAGRRRRRRLPFFPACKLCKPTQPPFLLRHPAAATAFAATVDAAGASTNYWLARWLLRDVVAGLFPARVHAFALEVRSHTGPALLCIDQA